MNNAEIKQYREFRETEIQLEEDKNNLYWESISRHEGSLGGRDAVFHLSRHDKRALVELHISQLRAVHSMLQAIMLAPTSDFLGYVKQTWPYGHFSVKSRTIRTPELGNFVAEAILQRNKRIRSEDTRLSLYYLYSADSPKSHDRTEEIISTRADELTFDNNQYISWNKPAQSANLHEIVAVVCEQSGIEVVEASPNSV